MEIIDNFLNQKDFDGLTYLYDENNFMINERLDWCVQKNITIPEKNENHPSGAPKMFFLKHLKIYQE